MKTLAAVEEDLRAEFEHAHVRAQFLQFLGLFASALVSAVVAGGFHVAGWAAVAGVVVGALGAAARERWPQVPWAAVLEVLHAGQQPADPPAAAPAAAPRG